MNSQDYNAIIKFIDENGDSSSTAIHSAFIDRYSLATIKRILSELLKENLLESYGQSKNTRYKLSPSYKLLHPIDLMSYYSNEIDDRNILAGYNFELINKVLPAINTFTKVELEKLNSLQNFKINLLLT